jgi:purine nucleosidase/pyrimidine-specific ribonucleoside hydrolase
VAHARPVVIDTDPGVDDALALLLAWSSPEIAVRALTTVAGNAPLEAATANAARLVALCQPVPRPLIAAGAAAPLVRPLRTAAHYHGQDGLGDVAEWPAAPVDIAPVSARELIANAAAELGEDLVLIALGPLTNVARVLETSALALSRVGRLVIMGGAVDVPGNVTPFAEFNMHVDPEAAARVFAAGLPIDLVPLDATHQVVLPRAQLLKALAVAPRALADLVGAFTARSFEADLARGRPGMILHDPLAVGVAVGDFVEWEPMRLTIEADGATRRSPGAPNCRVGTRVHADRFLAMFLERVPGVVA